ncbi:MAG: hypothetical protein OXG78_17395, partial [Chloroflexi bacterium]|nr:hypothetical protein [Chloroflexota bacterium]
PFLAIDMRNLDPSQINALEGFSKSRYAPDQTVRKIKISNLLEKELNQPSDDFVKHFARQVYTGSLFQSVIQEFRPLVKRAWDDLVDQEIARRVRRYEVVEEALPEPPQEPRTKEPAPTLPSSVTVGTPSLEVYFRYKGKRHADAKLILNPKQVNKSKIRLDDQELSVNAAAKKLIQSINPTISGFHAWWLWKVVDPETATERPLRDLLNDEELLSRVLGNFIL